MSQPSYASANGYIGETFFTVVMSAELDAANPPLTSAFAVQVNGTGVTVNSAVVNSSARTVTIGISGSALTAGDIIDFIYTDPTGGNDVSAIQGTDGLDSAGFSSSTIVSTVRQVTPPSVTGVTSATADGFQKVGDTVSVQVTFSETVNVTGTPQLLLETGATDRAAVYTSGAGTNTLTFTYTVQAGDASADLDYVSTSALSLNGGTIQSAGGVNATLVLAAPGAAGSLGANQAIVVDGVAPVITSVSIPQANFPSSTHPDDVHAYHVGDTVTATIRVSSDPGSYTLEASTIAGFTLGSLTRVNATTYTATFTVTAGATPYAAADSLPVSVTLRDAAGNLSNTFTTAITQPSDRIDTNAPPVPGVQTVTPALVDTAANDSFPVVQGTLVATDPESQTLTWGIPTNATAGSYVVNGVSYNLVSADIFGNAQYVNTQTGNYAYVFAAAYLNGMPGVNITTTANFSVSDGNRTVGVAAPLSFQGANDAPVLSAHGRKLQAVDQGIGDGANTGSTVTNMLASAGTATDAEYNPAFVLSGNTTVQGVTILPLGVAITSVNNQNGTWQYKVGAGAWTDIANVSAGNALLLTGADAVRFVPASGTYSGTDTGGITFKAWDRTSGTAGTQVNTTAGSAFSTGLASATIAVDALPTLSATGASATYGVGVSNPIDLFSNVSASTIEQGQYFVGARLTVSGVADATEVLTIVGTDVALVTGTVSLPGLGTAGGAASVTVTLTGGTATLVFSGLQQADAAMSALLNGMTYKNPGAGATPGNRVVSIAGLTDNGGSSGQTITSGASATVTVADVTAPAAPSTPQMTAGTDTGPSNTDAITGNATPTFTGTAEPFSTVTLYEGTTVLGSVTADGAGNWSITSSTLAAGPHSLTAKATDAASNVSQASGSLAVVIDTGAAAPAKPALAVASNSGSTGDTITSALTPTITGTAEAFASVTLYDSDGVTVLGTATAGSNGAWSIVTSQLSETTHTLTVKQTDRAGNVSGASAALTLTIDATAPAAPPTPLLATASDSGTTGDGITNVGEPAIIGMAEAGATVRLYDTDGTTLLGTAVADNTGAWRIVSSTLSLGIHTLTVKQTDAAGNVSEASGGLALTIEEAPAPPATTIDGVQVAQLPVILPGGGSGTQTTIPIVTIDRAESSGSGGVADIPLVTGGASGNLLLAQLPAGFGLSAAGGASLPSGDSLETLIAAILAATPDHPVADQGHLTGNGTTFLQQLAATVPLLVHTITPVSGGTAPAGRLALTGTSTDSQHTALVIDVTGLASGSTLSLNAVDFAAIVGSANVIGNTTGQILSGDAASQRFTVAAGSESAVFAGGGSDNLVFNPQPAPAGGMAGTQAASVPADTVILHGGLGDDRVTFSGAAADYTVENRNGHLLVTAKTQPDQHALVINAESLQFSDATVAIVNDASLNAIAGLYQSVLDRQADYVGISFWSGLAQSGVDLGAVALGLIRSAESQSLHAMVFNGDSAHDIELLYQGIFGRASDAGGLAFWVGQMASGATLEQVAAGFMMSQEIMAHRIGVQDWDFLVS